jgi:P-type Mg2+ transporter
MSRNFECRACGRLYGARTARCLVVPVGADTQYGDAIAKALLLRSPDTEFDRGLRRFGYLLMKMMMLLITVVVFTVHVALDRPPIVRASPAPGHAES